MPHEGNAHLSCRKEREGLSTFSAFIIVVIVASDIDKRQVASGGGVVYTRWGRTICPDTSGTELVYEGLAAGTDHRHPGGGANYLCLIKVPIYISNQYPSIILLCKAQNTNL